MASSLEGMNDLIKQLAALGDPKINQRILLAAVRAGMQPVLKEARSRVPVRKTEGLKKTYKGNRVGPGFAARSLRVVARINKRTGAAQALLGPRKEAFYATQFIELGTARIPRRPWLVPSFEAQSDEAVAQVASAMRKRIERIAKTAQRATRRRLRGA